jgi:hypothetical protein
MVNVVAAWIAIFAGVVAGMITGLFFHQEQFLGGYTGWSRRLVRLGHIALFGLGFINLGFALTTRSLGITSGIELPSILLIVGLVTMPLVCYLAAFRMPLCHLFVIPVLSVLAGVALFIGRLLEL